MHFALQRIFLAPAKVSFACAALIWLGTAFAPSALGAELEETRQQFTKGNYTEVIRLSEQAISDQEYSEEWRLLWIESLLKLGRYTNAQSVLTTNLERYASSVRLRLLGHEVLLRNGERAQAKALLQEIYYLARTRTWAYRDAPNLVALGKTLLLLGLDPKQALEQFFDRAKKADPANRDAYLASGQLALDKNDLALAAKVFGEGLKRFPEDADMHFGLAQAYAASERRGMIESLERVLTLNTNHVPSFLLMADHLIDGEEYQAATKMLEKALAVNPRQHEAWAYRAVLAHLAGDAKGEARARDTALHFWDTNPEVDQLIGRKLSQKYRFAEGAAYQRQALQFDAKYVPAKAQLAQDLLRLGQEQEGWKLVAEVHQDDGYDVTAYNLVGLEESMAKFRTLTNRDFIVRMSAKEAAIYGGSVLKLLDRAKKNLCAKYGMELTQPTIVEIFPDQKDFGVRTFGMPGNPGFLGVCFGHVITANSPASAAGHPANWQAVLWHEFCHVVTLQMTRNKMPRWLSEGISVYEERQENRTWGQDMNPRYREMILGKDLTPVGELSSAFLAPKSDLHLQFAYYESSLVVEFLVQKFGLESVQKILRDLGNGVEINAAIARHTAPLVKIEKDFAAFARERAQQLAPELDWEKPKPAELAKVDPQWLASHPKNFYALTRQAQKLLSEKKWQEAKAPLEKLLKFYPSNVGPDNAYTLLAEAHRGLGETNLERQVLTKLAAIEADAVDAYLRLMELGSAAKDWPTVAENAERFLAVNPLAPQPYRFLAEAREATRNAPAAIQAYETSLLLDPPDPAEVHFRLARLLHQSGDPKAKRHLLQSLEEAPRFREAHRLLLEMSRANNSAANLERDAARPAPATNKKP